MIDQSCQKNCTLNYLEIIKNKCFESNNKFFNKNIKRLKRDWFILHDIEFLYDYIINSTLFVVNDNIIEKLYCVYNKITNNIKCLCGNIVKFENASSGYRKYCSVKCRANDPKIWKQYKSTMVSIYGYDHPTKVPHLVLSKKEKLKDHGYLVTLNAQDKIKNIEKAKNTRFIRYGNKNVGWNSKAIATRIKNKTLVPENLRESFQLYTLAVKRFTKESIKNFPEKIDNIEKRDNHAKNPNAYHIDHKLSKFDGFNNNIPPFIIGHWTNLRCIPFIENLKKQKTSIISTDELLENFYNEKI